LNGACPFAAPFLWAEFAERVGFYARAINLIWSYLIGKLAPMKLFRASVLIAVLIANGAFASQEGALIISRFRLESDSIEPKSTVVVEGSCGPEGEIRSLVVSAYGRKCALTAEKLMQLRGISPNGMRLSEAPGDSSLGGRVLRVHLTMGFPAWTYQSVVVTIHEDGMIDVGKIEENEPTSVVGSTVVK
jgi:hypothetical protein